jgi:DNA-binding transcriptional LysR family regulator
MADMHALKKLDLNLLKVFESLYVEQNMTRTADALHITPSAVSHSIKRLRDCLGDPLFQRSNNRMLPTPACQRMAPLIIDNLTRLRQIMQHWGEFQPLTSEHHFRIGMHYALEPSILPALTTRLASLAPNVTFSSVKVDRVTLTRDLSAGHMDLALDVALPIKSPVLHQKLINDDFCVLMRSEHPLTQNMSKDAYFSAGHIGVSNRSSGASVEDLLFQQQGFSRKVVIRCQNYYSAKSMAANSDNLLTVPRRLAEHLRQDDVALFDLPISIAPISTHMYWHKNTEQDSALFWLRALFDGIFVG